MTVKPMLVATPGRELRWLGLLGLGGLFDGEHFFVPNANADGSTRLTHGETFSGIFVAVLTLVFAAVAVWLGVTSSRQARRRSQPHRNPSPYFLRGKKSGPMRS